MCYCSDRSLTRDTNIKRVVALCLFVFLISNANASQTTLTVTFLSADPTQTQAVSNWVNRFESIHPHINVNLRTYSDKAYKQNIEGWLQSGDVDVLYWQTGKRLDELVNRQLIRPLQPNTLAKGIESIASPLLPKVSYNDSIYAFPFAQYAWGVYYNKEIFREHGLSVPDSWEAFMALCEKLKSLGIPPLVQANADDWEHLIWLDYLSVLQGGQLLRNALLNKQPLPEEGKDALTGALLKLASGAYFFAPGHTWQWQQAIRIIMRKSAAMTVTGQFAEDTIVGPMSDDIGFFAFPGSDNTVTVAPTDVFMLSAKSQKRDAASTFMRFLSEEQTQVGLARELGWLPANLTSADLSQFNQRARVAAKALDEAPLIIDYFDRER